MKAGISTSIKIQQQASNPENSVYLAASAGTGKTKTLVDRVLRFLLDGVKIEEILCITFTNAAANEMLERLKSRLESWFLMPEECLSLSIKELIGKEVTVHQLQYAKQLYTICLNNFEKFRIQTLHSFCAEVLSQLHYIDGNELDKIKIIDNYTKKRLIEVAYEKVAVSSRSKIEVDLAITRLAHKYDYTDLLNLVFNLLSQKQNLYNFLNSHGSIQELVDEQYKFFRANKQLPADDITDRFITHNMDELTADIKHSQGEETLRTINEWCEGDLSFRKVNLSEYIDCFLTKSMEPRIRLPFSKHFRDNSLAFIDLYKLEQQRIIDFLEAKTAYEQAEFMQYLIIFINQITIEYEKLKEELGYLEYDDLILKVLMLFEENNDAETLLFSLNLYPTHILIDEAQDLSKSQWRLMQKVIGSLGNSKNTIFMVGDYKQSIYGFQGAEPEYFLEINQLYKTKFTSWECLELTHSFRSQKEILEAVDKIFNSVGLTDNLVHIAIKEGIGKVNVIQHSYQEPKKDRDTEWSLPQKEIKMLDKKQHSAKELALFIEHLLGGGNVEPQDIMVLFRKRGEKVGYFIEELRKKNISVSQTDQVNLNENILILDLLSLVKFFLLPEDDLNLASLLKSSLFCFSEDALFKITYGREENTLWAVLQDVYPKISKTLSELKEEYQSGSIYQFYTNILYKRQFIRNLNKEFGSSSYEVVDIFLDKVLEFENTYHRGGQSFIEWIQANAQISIKNDHIQGVRVITAHAAKGLQSPIVIIADASDSENLPTDNYFWHEDRLIVQYSSQYEILALTKIKHAKNIKAKQESLRLLYVAMTRAENELYIFGDEKGRDGSWYGIAKSILPENCVLFENLTLNKMELKSDAVKSVEVPTFLKNKHDVGKNQVHRPVASTGEQIYSNLSVVRGVFIHKILSEISKIPERSWVPYIQNLANMEEFKVIEDEEVDNIIRITQIIVSKFPKIFYGQNVLSEVNIKTDLDGELMLARIDKLVINDEGIEIIEIKADKSKRINPNMLPLEYKKQLEIYKKCISLAYPGKNITYKVLSFYQQKLLEFN
ncbi:UvrD-helicase domain-containing protein [Candidatus Bandiella euplotis]|uniref:DNA 3'-5' helicase n=1 Tax=Candidatus Bandiella euplotis TaxID=1664265 RepID=A0ABZ0UJ00_9RICK|nr:UvrD-helicase domain-containing protein [Candidatus Bandiella woodruffii]WPX96053.1 AddA family double-strand break repair helicase subunit A [Candidatus Bandiella woodruffii]